MKKIFSLLITLCSLAAFGQYPVSSISITLPPNPAANTADWAMPFVITAQAKLVQGQVPGNLMESRILVTIKEGRIKPCGSYTQQTAPMSNFNTATKTWSGAAGVGLLGNGCTLKPGTYELCVQFFSSYAPVVPLSGEVCKSFTIADTKQQSYSPPQNIMPANGKVFTEQESNMPIMLRWTPVVPKPQGDVLYKVRLIEILPGQNKTEALRTNTPIDILEVKNNTQVSYKLSKRITGLYWEVEAESAKSVQGEKPRSYGKSEATSITFKKSDEDAKLKELSFTAPKNITPADGKVFSKDEAKQPIMFRWTPVQPKPKADVQYKLRVVELKAGQTPGQAIRTNTTLFEKVVTNQTQLLSGVDPIVVWPIASDSKYAWNVQAYINGILIGESEATTFDPCCTDTSGDAPKNVLPVDGQNFTQKEARQPIQLRWTQKTPPPVNNDIMYTVYVYAVEKGQTPVQAIKNNKPVFEKQVKTKETTWQMPAEYTNSKETKTFVWKVRATDKEGKAVGRNNGTSEPTTFTRSSSTCSHSANITSIECLGMVNGLQQYKVCVEYKNTATLGCSDCDILLNTPGNYGAGITIVSTNPNTVINTILPTVPVSLTAGQQTTICFNATVTPGNNLKFQIHATCNDASATLPEIDRNHENSLFDTLPPSCICKDCDKAKINFNNITTTAAGTNGDQYNIAGNISVTGLPVYGLEFEVQSFSYTSTPAACSNGVTTLEQSGMFLIPATTINGSSAIQVFNETASPGGTNNNASKDVKLVSTTQMPSVIPFNLTIGLPGPLTGLDAKCCKMKYKVCIRVTVYYDKDSCKSCVFTKCFEFTN